MSMMARQTQHRDFTCAEVTYAAVLGDRTVGPEEYPGTAWLL
jgi:hypothetical protein